jgi:hypothetical protein
MATNEPITGSFNEPIIPPKGDNSLRPCPISGRDLHDIVDQGPATWDFGNIIYEGQQMFCRTCEEAILYVDTERRIK